jgi:hypothetical protein
MRVWPYNLIMRTFFTVFLVVFLPMQNAWASIAAYCTHNSQVTSQLEFKKNATHLGHHEHESQVQSIESPADDSSINTNVDSDCSVCHIACCAVVLPNFYTALQLVLSSNAATPHYLAIINDIIDTIERPVWQLIL